tara:strand:- start:3381 stop:3602 length:222 start_codon:yes stop_codon:yes gene_type:complete
MSGIFGGGTPPPTQAQKDAEKAQSRAEERATSQERTEMQGAQDRRRLRRTGGMRLLFSPARTEGPQKTKLGVE